MLDKTNKLVDEAILLQAKGGGILKPPSRSSLPSKQPRSTVPQKAPEPIKALYRKFDPYLNARERFLRSAFRDRDSIYDVYKRFYEYEYRARKGEETMIQLFTVDMPDQSHHLEKISNLLSDERTLFDKFEATFKARGWDEMENLKNINRDEMKSELERILTESKINPENYKEVLDASVLVDQKSMLADNNYKTKRDKLTSLQSKQKSNMISKKKDPQPEEREELEPGQSRRNNSASDLRREIDREIEEEMQGQGGQTDRSDRGQGNQYEEGMRIEDVGKEGDQGEIDEIQKIRNDHADDDYEYKIKNLILGNIFFKHNY